MGGGGGHVLGRICGKFRGELGDAGRSDPPPPRLKVFKL